MSESNDTEIVERSSIATANAREQNQGMAKKGIVLAIVVLLGGLMVWATWERGDKDVVEDKGRPGSIRVNEPFAPAAEPAVFTPAIIESPKQQLPKPTMEQQTKTNELLEASRRAPVMAFTARIRPTSENTVGQAAAQNAGLPIGFPGTIAAGAANPDTLAEKLKSITLTGAKARQIANLHMTVPKGTHIPCTLETAMSSEKPGLVSCIVMRDVLSGSGQVVLVEKGSKAFGEYQNGIKRGQKRMFALWTEVRTPKGVVVTLDSPATDALGRAGLTGKIDKKFWERFGGALLLSIVTDASGFVFERASEELEIDFNSSSEAPDDAIGIAVEQTKNIQPAIYINQGAAVNIFVARDLDFSDVYRLRRTESLSQIYDRTLDTDIYELPLVVK